MSERERSREWLEREREWEVWERKRQRRGRCREWEGDRGKRGLEREKGTESVPHFQRLYLFST